MKRALALTLLLSIFVLLVTRMQAVKIAEANFFPEKPPHAVYIKVKGSIEPATAPIKKVGNTYTFTGDIVNQPIVVERDNIVIDGAGFTLQGNGSHSGIEMSYRGNVTISNLHIKSFYHGIFSYNSFNNKISGNTITENGRLGIYLIGASKCVISDNLVENNENGVKCTGSTLHHSSYIVDNIVRYNVGVGIYNFTDNIFSDNVVENNGVNFSLHKSEPTPTPEPTATPTPTPEPTIEPESFPASLVAASSVTVAVVLVGLGLLLYRIKRK